MPQRMPTSPLFDGSESRLPLNQRGCCTCQGTFQLISPRRQGGFWDALDTTQANWCCEKHWLGHQTCPRVAEINHQARWWKDGIGLKITYSPRIARVCNWKMNPYISIHGCLLRFLDKWFESTRGSLFEVKDFTQLKDIFLVRVRDIKEKIIIFRLELEKVCT